MTSSKFQNLLFILCFGFSLYILGFGFPSHLKKYLSLQSPPPDQTPENASETVTFIPFSTDAIQIKASGEDPTDTENELQDYMATHKVFEDRFGNSFEDAWKTQAPVNEEFPVPDSIKSKVDFWTQVFGVYGKDQFVFHHAEDTGIVYSVIDLSDLNPYDAGISSDEVKTLRGQYIAEERNRIQKLLKKIDEKISEKKSLTKEEKRIAALFDREGAPPLSKAMEKGNIRLQGGFAHRFRQAIVLSGQYMQEMENIFSMKGLPIELTRIPLVESAFNIRAVSSADAVGLWQFIPDTGKRYLKIDDYVDERRDPILATYAAATHLKSEYNLLGGSWPLAINAYNTGPGRMLKAVKELKTKDIATIINNFDSPGYQFYSRNYYPEFLAALHVYENRESYFGEIETMPQLEYDFFLTRDDINLRDLANSVDVSWNTIVHLNPAFSQKIIQENQDLPSGYLVRVPKQLGMLFAQASAAKAKEAEETRWHIVAKGETLQAIANVYDLPIENLESVNPYLPNEHLTEGMVIELPRGSGVAMNPK